MPSLSEFLQASAAHHKHLCPRQVLGVRMGMRAAVELGLDLPQTNKRLYTFVETDGCLVDGVIAATGCNVGRRTLQIVDFGKVAATFVDMVTGTAIRIFPHPDSRRTAPQFAPGERDRWHAQLIGYQAMPDEALLVVQPVVLSVSMAAIISRPGVRAVCAQCGEEVINEREVERGGIVLCRSCAGESYYQLREPVAVTAQG
jgi:formylmethanofuran dehydrogenase subunit E